LLVQAPAKNRGRKEVKIAKNFSIALFTLTLLSCYSNANNKNMTVLQEVAIATEQHVEAPLQSVPLSEQAKVAKTADIPEMTLIPSVEPELLRNVMPNSWRKLSRLTETEEQTFIMENADALSEIDRSTIYYDRHLYLYYSIYRQDVGFDTFYRIIATTDSNPDFMSRSISFTQSLVYQNTLLFNAVFYNHMEATQYDYAGIFVSIDIISGAERAKVVLLTSVTVRGLGRNGWSEFSSGRDGQLSGSTESSYYLMYSFFSEGRLPIPQEITASRCLVDPDIPLRYSLQNAFDGDLSTSYVYVKETDYDLPYYNYRMVAPEYDDLIYININYTNYEEITRIAVINGYAQNPSLYRKNNRIKTIGVESFEWNDDHSFITYVKRDELLLRDDSLTYQFFNARSIYSRINVLEIYRGEVDNTCLAEINLYVDGYGWLFGDIDEQ